MTAIDTLAAAVRSRGADGGRSPLATAALYEQLHAGNETRISHVLLVKAQAGSASDLREDRSFGRDTFTTIADVHITLMLLEAESGRLLDAGTSTATAIAAGKIGDVPAVRKVPTGSDKVGVARQPAVHARQ